MPSPSTSPDPIQLDILSTAVRLVSDRKIRKVVDLRADLLTKYPGHDDDIDAALRLWAREVARSQMH